jgi:hypothetical protein
MAQQEQVATTATPDVAGVAAPRGLKLIIGAMVFAALIYAVAASATCPSNACDSPRGAGAPCLRNQRWVS